MRARFVLTLSGPDRIGIVDELTGRLLERGGNVEMSRMARLGGEFAVLMLVELPADRSTGLESALSGLTSRGYKLTVTASRPGTEVVREGWRPYRIEVRGADHEGIIHEVAHYLSNRGINIEQMDSECVPGATSGVPLFAMTAEVVAPPGLADDDWQPGLKQLAGQLNLEVDLKADSAA